MTNSPAKLSPAVLSSELIERYRVPVPRYTSYPSADRFLSGDSGFDSADFIAALRNSASADAPIAWYVHLPFCAHMCAYCGCNMAVSNNPDTLERYLRRLHKEIEAVGEYLSPKQVATGVHFGGGTPNTYNAKDIGGIVEALEKLTPFADDAERSIEIDPRLVDTGDIHALHQANFDRISMGVQDFDPDVQKAIGREQSFEKTKACVLEAREAGFQSINLDLIYGLPLQTKERFETTVHQVLELMPERIALFGYAHLPTARPNQRLIIASDLPSADARVGLYQMAAKILMDHGYTSIGLDHFALESDPLCIAQREGTLHRSFQGYTTVGGIDLVGVGMSSISQVGGAFAQNAKRSDDYAKAIDQSGIATVRGLELSDDDRLRARLIEQVMCNLSIEWKNWGEVPRALIEEVQTRLRPLEADGLVHIDNDGLRVTDMGQPLVRHVAAAFDAYLVRDQAQRPYSAAL